MIYTAIVILVLAGLLVAASLRLASTSRRLDESLLENSRLSTELAVARQRLDDERALASERFKAVASDVLAATQATMDARSRSSIDAVLAPVKSSIDIFTRDFKACYETERADRVALRGGIDTLAALNRSIGEETRRLTHALKGDKGFQGRWGEMVLSNVLEHSGLERGRWVSYQQTGYNDDGRRLRPDAVITCPRGRRVIIDAKCSLTAYMQLAEADDDTRRTALAREHVAAIDRHIKALAARSYQDFIGDDKADFVVMFIPHEGAFMAAMTADENLWQRAYDARVIIASPVHLITVVKLIEQMWVSEDRNNNALKIADEAVKMLDKLTAVYEELVRLDKHLKDASASYDEIVKKLRTGNGNVTRRIDTLASLGVKASRRLPRDLNDHD